MDFETIYRQYFDVIYRYCYLRLQKDPHTAEDLTSETFGVLFESWEKLRERSETDLLKWLYRTAGNLLMAHSRRKKQRESVAEKICPDELAAEPELYCNLENDLYEHYLCEIRGRLTDKECSLFDRIVTDHCPLPRIAKELNLSEKALQMRWCRLREKIRKELREIL